jgi:O-antigen/teichoic acid export membrane protein
VTAAADSLSQRAGKGLLWLGLVNVVSKGSQMAVTLTLAACLTEADLGLVAVAVALVTMAQVVQAMGVYEVIARTERSEHAMAGTVLTMSLVVSVTTAVLGIVGASWIADVLGAPAAAPLVAVVAISLPFTAIGGVQMALMHRALDFRQRMLPDAGSAVLGSMVTIGLAIAGFGALSLAIGLVVSAVLQPIFGYVVGVRVGPVWDRSAAGEAVKWIGIVGPAAVAASVLANVDYPVITRVLGPEATGLYSLAFRIAWMPYVLGAVVMGAVAFPVYSKMFRDRRVDDVPVAVGQFTRVVLVVVGGVYLIVALMSDSIVMLGHRWAPAAPTLVILCGFGLGLSLLVTWYEIITASGRPKQFLFFEIAHLVLVVALLLTVTKYGINAVAFAQLAAVWCILPLVWYAMVRAKVAPPHRDLARAVLGFVAPAVACLAVYAVVRGFAVISDPTSIIGSALELSLLVSCYGAVGVLANKALLRSLRNVRRSDVG